MRVLVVNAGSSSLKLRVVDAANELLGSCDLDAVKGEPAAGELARALRELGEVDAVGHRIVHGGERYREAVVIDAQVRKELAALTDLAPLHQPKSLAALDTVSELLPDVPAVACFDTAFHATLPPAAATYAVPREWRERWGVRRYGFHGLSHAWIARRAAELTGRPTEELRTVSCHLGAGASLAAIAGGESVDTTMGFTPLEGLVMATRSGSVDPGLVLWLQEHESLSAGELADTLEHHSGLLALGGSADMRELVERRAAGDDDAKLAFDVYVHQLRRQIGAMAAALGGVDVLAFTGGVGEHAPTVRAAAGGGLAHLGVQIDEQRNADADGDRDVSTANSIVTTLVISAREDLEIARAVHALLAAR